MDEMTNYTNMLRMNEKVCEEKRILAIDTMAILRLGDL